MKKLNLNPSPLLSLILVLLLATSCLSGRKASGRLAGEDLAKLERDFARKVSRGNSKYLLNLAEVQFFRGRFFAAYTSYGLADSIGISFDDFQLRNYVHAALATGNPVPSFDESGFFQKNEELDIEIATFCGNSANEDIVPYIWDEFLFVTSSRRTSAERYVTTGKPFLNVVSFGEGCQTIPIPELLPTNLNDRFHNGPIAISGNGNLVVINRNYIKPNREGFHNLYLDYYVKKSGKWSKPEMLPFCNPKYSVQHPFYNDEEQTLYFSANMPGGHGGFDLYKSEWDGNKWKEPVNLGPEVNSIFDEVFPVFSPDGNLIYSTNHIETYGGLDIVLFKDNQRFLFPPPLNSPYDDFGITFSNEFTGFFGSNRDRGMFEENIYLFSLIDKMLFGYQLQVVDYHTGESLNLVEVGYGFEAGDLSGTAYTNNDGKILLFRSELLEGKPVVVEISRAGYCPLKTTITEFLVGDESNTFVALLKLEPEQPSQVDIAEGPEHITSGNIVVYFQNDSPGRSVTVPNYWDSYKEYMAAKSEYYKLTSSPVADMDTFFLEVEMGMKSLNDFAEYLHQNIEGNDVEIFLEGFASPLSSFTYNKRLSERRNESIKRFFEAWNGGALEPFISNGKIRITGVFHGDTKVSPGVSDSMTNLAESVYGIDASRERRVVLHYTWTGQPMEIDIPDTETESTTERQEDDHFQGFYIIVGVFSNEASANRFAQSLKRRGYEKAGILEAPEIQKFRVYANKYHHGNLAEHNLPIYQRSIIRDAWILRVGF